MTRSVRHFLVAALIACHAAVTLCGPCLHELPGSSHQFGPAGKTHRPDAPAKSATDSADNCLICHFVAQRQLTVAAMCERGYADRMVLSHDAACFIDWFPPAVVPQFAPSWHFQHLFDDVLPALRERGVSDAQIDAMLVANPRRYFGG